MIISSIKSRDSCKPRNDWIHDNFLILVHVYSTYVGMTQNITHEPKQYFSLYMYLFSCHKNNFCRMYGNLNISPIALSCPVIFFHSVIFQLSFTF